MKFFLSALLFTFFLVIIFGFFPKELTEILAYFSLGICLGTLCENIVKEIL